MKKLQHNILDKRTRKINLDLEVIAEKDISEHIKTLPDDSEWADELKVYEEEEEKSVETVADVIADLV